MDIEEFERRIKQQKGDFSDESEDNSTSKKITSRKPPKYTTNSL